MSRLLCHALLLGSLAVLIRAPALAAPCEPSAACALEQVRSVLLQKAGTNATERTGWEYTAYLLLNAESQRGNEASRRAMLDWLVTQAELQGYRTSWLCRTIDRRVQAQDFDGAIDAIAKLPGPSSDKSNYDAFAADVCREDAYDKLAEGFGQAGRYQDAELALSKLPAGGLRMRAQLRLAGQQIRAGATGAARLSVQGIGEPFTDRAKAILASAAVADGDFAGARKIAASTTNPSILDGTLAEIAQRQLERKDPAAALETMRERLAELTKRAPTTFEKDAFSLAISFGNAGAATDALELLERADRATPGNLALVALRLIDAGNFAGAEQLYARIFDDSPRATPSAIPPQPIEDWVIRSVAEGRLLSGMAPEQAIKPLPATDVGAVLRTAARQLARKGQAQRASELLALATDRALRISGCLERSESLCRPYFRSNAGEFVCGSGTRSLELCSIAGLQAQLGLLTQAQELVPKIELPVARTIVLTEIAKTQFAARQIDRGRQSLALMMQAANTPPLTRDAVCIAMESYAERMLETPTEIKEVPATLLEAARQYPKLAYGSTPCNEAAVVKLASGYAKIGRLDAAFQVAQVLEGWERMSAYVSIYRNAP